jgi:hypothetical protein
MTSGPVGIAARLVAIGIPVLGCSVLLHDFRSDVSKHLAPDVLVFPELLAFASSAVSHGSLLGLPLIIIAAMLPTYEQLGLFYLGRRFDLGANARQDEPILYESRDLVTHAVCIGMTGSGKTGLGITIIEEAAIDQIPVLAIDPKGDLSNLLLTFPDLAPADFAPWIDERQARSQQLTREAAAERAAAGWKQGLAEWDQDGARIARLKSAVDVRVYTPGSNAGIPLSVLKALRVETDEPEEAAARATTVAASLLSLAGVNDVGPHSREHALVAALLNQGGPHAGTDLPRLVEQILRPPFDRIGVMDLEGFYPARDRQELALRFNSVLATPGFDIWMKGEPVDLSTMLFDSTGRPRIAIVSVAHLDEGQRMMAVALLLNAAVQWTRRQGGSSSLRALLYMDEVFGYLPPVANPPSKVPLLTLLKQARASGVGVMLATQNPVDLDYKALSNTGTWFLGKLQTERDKSRVLDGLEGVSSSWTREQLDKTLTALRSRVFLMHNVHEQEPVTFETRWALSYLRGPLTREELQRAIGAPGGTQPAPAAAPPGRASDKPVLPAGVAEYFLPSPVVPAAYEPVLYGSALVQYTDARRGIDVAAPVQAITPVTGGALAVSWDAATPIDVAPESLTRTSANAAARFGALPAAATNAKNYAAWAGDFEQWIVRAKPLRLYSAPAYRLNSRPGESEADFSARVQQAAREKRDAAVEKLRAKYASRVARATEKIRRAEDSIAREQQQVSQQKTQTAVSLGATLLGALMGRKAVSLSTLGRATTTARGVGRSMKEAADVAQAQERRRAAEEELQAIEAELQREVQALHESAPDVVIDTTEVKPKRAGVDVRLVALAWKPS